MMERRREDCEQARSDQDREGRNRLVEEKPTEGLRMEWSFDVAHVTWLRRIEEESELVELGQASEPMS